MTWFSFVWVPYFIAKFIEIDETSGGSVDAWTLNVINLIFLVVVIPCVGLFTDKLGFTFYYYKSLFYL